MQSTAGPIRLVIVGATGMAGGYALRYALGHDSVERVTSIGRKDLGISHPKLIKGKTSLTRLHSNIMSSPTSEALRSMVRLSTLERSSKINSSFSNHIAGRKWNPGSSSSWKPVRSAL